MSDVCSNCTEMVEDHKKLLQRLKDWAFGINEVDGVEKRLKTVEKSVIKIEKNILILIVFTGILIIASVPDLLKLFRII